VGNAAFAAKSSLSLKMALLLALIGAALTANGTRRIMTTAKQSVEYSRRNLLHASAVGAEAGARVSLARVKRWKNPPKWLVASLEGVHERAVQVSAEMAAHRNEMLDSQGKGRT